MWNIFSNLLKYIKSKYLLNIFKICLLNIFNSVVVCSFSTGTTNPDCSGRGYPHGDQSRAVDINWDQGHGQPAGFSFEFGNYGGRRWGGGAGEKWQEWWCHLPLLIFLKCWFFSCKYLLYVLLCNWGKYTIWRDFHCLILLCLLRSWNRGLEIRTFLGPIWPIGLDENQWAKLVLKKSWFPSPVRAWNQDMGSQQIFGVL